MIGGQKVCYHEKNQLVILDRFALFDFCLACGFKME
jgi:hypothetical protein